MLNKIKNQNRNGNIKFFGGIVLILVCLVFFNACTDAASERAAEVGGVTAQQIIDNPQAYEGKTVTVSGDIEEIFDPRAFNIDSGASVGELLVIGTSPFPKVSDRAYVSGDIATVTGVVKILTSVEEVEREIGWDLTPQIETTYKMKPVLIAQNSSFRAGTVTNDKPVGTDTEININNNPDGTADTTVVRKPVSETEIVNFSDYEKAVDRKSFVGKRVRLEAINVESVVGDRAFYVGTSPTKRILIIFEEEPDRVTNKGFDGKIDVDKGQKVTIDGIVRLMPPVEEAKRRFGKLMTAETLNGLKDETTYIFSDDPKIVQNAK